MGDRDLSAIQPEERRLERLRSAAAEDHRISYGCINFYADVVLKAFAGGSGVVYILPDTRSPEEVFPGLAVFAPASAAIKSAADGLQAPPTGADPHLADPGAAAAAAASDAPAVEGAPGDPGR